MKYDIVCVLLICYTCSLGGARIIVHLVYLCARRYITDCQCVCVRVHQSSCVSVCVCRKLRRYGVWLVVDSGVGSKHISDSTVPALLLLLLLLLMMMMMTTMTMMM